MRIYEILNEDYNQQLSTELENILIGAKAAGVTELKPEVVVKLLQRSGYSVDVDALISLLQNNPSVSNISPESIHLAGSDTSPTDSSIDGESSADHVDRLAKKASQKELK